MKNTNSILHQEESTSLERLVKLNYLAKAIYEANQSNSKLDIMDITNQEVQAFLRSLHNNKVKYMLVGGLATVYHGHVRTTQDLDLWVEETPQNKERLIKTLKEVNVAGADSYLNIPMIPGYSTITIGDHGFVADLMGYTKAFAKEDFDACYKFAKHSEFDNTPITVIHVNHLIEEKQRLGRPKDIDDVKNLQRILKERGA